MAIELIASDPALVKLANVLGREQADALIGEILRRLGLNSLATPDDRLRFGAELVSHGGVLSAIGRAIKIQAILHGANGG